jgi:hypothetical protein
MPSQPFRRICTGVPGGTFAAVLWSFSALAQSPGTFTQTGNLTTPLQFHTATLLQNGKVLLAGGFAILGGKRYSQTAEIYDPATGIFSVTGDLTEPGTCAVLDCRRRGEPGAILHGSTHQIVSAEDPAVAGETVEIYDGGLVDGSVIPPHVSIGGKLAELLYFETAPKYPGLNQINVRVPKGLASGPTVPVHLNYLGRPSNEVPLAVALVWSWKNDMRKSQ